MLVKPRETSFPSAGLFRAFNKLDHDSLCPETWEARVEDLGALAGRRLVLHLYPSSAGEHGWLAVEGLAPLIWMQPTVG